MLRDGGDGHGESHPDAYTNTHADTNTNCNANTYSRAGYAWKHFDSTASRYR